MRRLWLIFAQACTVSLAVLFVVSTLKPEWLSRSVQSGSQVVMVQEDASPAMVPTAAHLTTHISGAPMSYAEAVKKAMPSVVNLYSSKENRSRHPMWSQYVTWYASGTAAMSRALPSRASAVSAGGHELHPSLVKSSTSGTRCGGETT